MKVNGLASWLVVDLQGCAVITDCMHTLLQCLPQTCASA